MPGGAELAVLACGGDLGEHVFVNVAFGVAVFHWDCVEAVDCFLEEGRCGDGEPGISHVLRVGGVFGHFVEEREDVFVDHFVHFGWGEVLEP